MDAGVRLLDLDLCKLRGLEQLRRMAVSRWRISFTRARDAVFAVVQSERFGLLPLKPVTREPMPPVSDVSVDGIFCEVVYLNLYSLCCAI